MEYKTLYWEIMYGVFNWNNRSLITHVLFKSQLYKLLAEKRTVHLMDYKFVFILVSETQ
jgi:hypothetical protein